MSASGGEQDLILHMTNWYSFLTYFHCSKSSYCFYLLYQQVVTWALFPLLLLQFYVFLRPLLWPQYLGVRIFIIVLFTASVLTTFFAGMVRFILDPSVWYEDTCYSQVTSLVDSIDDNLKCRDGKLSEYISCTYLSSLHSRKCEISWSCSSWGQRQRDDVLLFVRHICRRVLKALPLLQ